jgi:hypothetical protein
VGVSRPDLDAMVAVAHAHAAAEEAGDIDATMATLDDDPIYELLPMGRRLQGREAARQYYEHFFGVCMPKITGFQLRSEWVTDEGVGQEYQLTVDDGTGPQRFDIIGILTFGANERLSGERIWASDELIKILFGPVLDRTEKIA